MIENLKNNVYNANMELVEQGLVIFTWGKSISEAVLHAVVLEQVAKMAYIAFTLNPRFTMNEFLVKKHFSRKYGSDKYYGQ